MSRKHKYPREIIEGIRHKTDIEKIISEYVELKKTGGLSGDYIGLCPFHREKTPSFRVVTTKQFFYCFGCGAGGDVFNFLMRIKGLRFLESVEYLGRRLNLL